MKYTCLSGRSLGEISPLIYGHFIEHFHRQIYGGVFDPGSPLSDEDGFRVDVLEAMRHIKVPILRWPGGCYVSSYHWKEGVGKNRIPSFDKAWRVEDPNTFGTDEYIKLCRKIGCEPYICTNAGTGTAEEMSDWVEYCNLKEEGRYAKWRIANGCKEPHNVRFWSIGNENYGSWEIGTKCAEEWGRLVKESAKMIRHVDPSAELTAAALDDIEWNMNLLKSSGMFLDWISIHGYWDPVHETNDLADYDTCMAYTNNIESSVRRVKGLLIALGLEKKIKIAFDEWNLRGWYHPNVHTIKQGAAKEEYLYPRDKNDINSQYTMADAVFSACFLNMCCRNCDMIGMAGFAPIINTRGCIFTYDKGIVLRSTYYVFDLYVHYLGNVLLDGWMQEEEKMQVKTKNREICETSVLDVVFTYDTDKKIYAAAVVNKSADRKQKLTVDIPDASLTEYRIITVYGESTEAYNDIGRTEVTLTEGQWTGIQTTEYIFEPHSVNIIQFR